MQLKENKNDWAKAPLIILQLASLEILIIPREVNNNSSLNRTKASRMLIRSILTTWTGRTENVC